MAESGTTPTRTSAATPSSPRRRVVRRFVPPQHGAWAMLIVPYLAGVVTVGFHWPHVPLLGALLAGYPLSYYIAQAAKTCRPDRVRPQLLCYAPMTAAFGGAAIVACPRLLWYSPAYAVLATIHLGYARIGRDRSLGNDLTTVALSTLTIPVTATIADTDLTRVAVAGVAVAAYFAGTIFYVKTMIRERGKVGFRRVSVAYHLVALALAACLSVPLAGVFLVLLIRSAVLPRRRIAPKTVGVLEMLFSALLLVAIIVG